MKRMDDRTANYLAHDAFSGLKELNSNVEKHLIDLYTCNLHAVGNLDIVTLPGRRSSGTSDKGKEQQEYQAFIRFANYEHYPMYKIVSFVEVVESTMPFVGQIKHQIVEDLAREDFAVKVKEALTTLYESGIGDYTNIGLIDSVTRQYQPYFDHPYVVGDTPLEDFTIRKLVKQRNISSFLEGFFHLNLDKLRTEFENKKNMDEYYKYFN